MTEDGLTAYNDHIVWDAVEDARINVREANVTDANLKARLEATLTEVILARAHFGSFAHLDVLDRIRALVTQLADEAQVQQFLSFGNLSNLYEQVRLLPPPQAKDVTPRVEAALKALQELNNDEITALQERVKEAETTAAAAVKAAEKVQVSVDSARDSATSAKATVEETARTATEQFDKEWKVKLQAWEGDAKAAETQRESDARAELAVMVAAAATSQSLVEQAAGNLVATEWALAAKKHRRGSRLSLWFGVASFAAAALMVVIVAALGADEADRNEFQWGMQLVRLAAAAPLLAIGAFLFAERSRLNREASSAQDVATLVTNFDSFFQTSDPEKRKEAREELGKVLFNEGLRSRFTSRDASKHAGLSSNDVQQLVELAKGFGTSPRPPGA